MLAAKAAAEEALRREEEEERLREEAEEAALKASEAADQATREAKKEKERLKREELRKQGKLLSKSEKEKQRINQIKLEQLKAASGIVIGSSLAGAIGADGEAKPKRPDYSKKKHTKKQTETTESKEAIATKTADEESGNETESLYISILNYIF